METVVERVFAPAWLVFGISHALHPKLFAELFAEIRRSRFAGLIIGAYTLPAGLLLIVCHNVWVWDWPVLVTGCE
jgi:general stress protein CsbA